MVATSMFSINLGFCTQRGSVVASDAFFPFPDGVEEGAKAGATAVIQAGGSVRDNEGIAAAGPAQPCHGFHWHALLLTLKAQWRRIVSSIGGIVQQGP